MLLAPVLLLTLRMVEYLHVGVAKLVDALALGASVARHGSSTLPSDTKQTSGMRSVSRLLCCSQRGDEKAAGREASSKSCRPRWGRECLTAQRAKPVRSLATRDRVSPPTQNKTGTCEPCCVHCIVSGGNSTTLEP